MQRFPAFHWAKLPARAAPAFTSPIGRTCCSIRSRPGASWASTSAPASPGQKGLPLQIGEKKYEKGLGHHASGEIIIDLDGQYDTFTAEVGVQPLPNGVGTVVFKVFVDDELKFDSGVMKGGEPAKSVSISVAGAGELRLVATDAGDGINCDVANWADAKLVKSAAPNPRRQRPGWTWPRSHA